MNIPPKGSISLAVTKSKDQNSHSSQTDSVQQPERQSAKYPQRHTNQGHHGGSFLTGKFKTLVQIGCSHFMQRNGGSQRCQHQQYVKHEREDIAHPRYTLESQLEHIGQSDKHQSRTGIGRQPRNRIDCRKMMKPANTATNVSINATLPAVFTRLASRVK